MFSKTTIFLAFAAISSIARAAAPPGCILGAVNSYEDPTDISGICKSDDATSKIEEFCGDATEDALSAFADICEDAGVEISTDLPTSTKSSKSTATGFSTGSATATGTGAPYPTGGAGNGGMASGSGGAGATPTASGGPPQSTGAAGKLEVGIAALFAGFGLLAAF